MLSRLTMSQIPACVILAIGILTATAVSAQDQGNLPPLPPGGFYVTDVSNPDHNPAIVAAQSHLIYINNPPSYFGDPATFLTDLGQSEYIHMLDQYVGSSANHRYTLGKSFNPSYPIPANRTLTMSDVLSIVHSAAQSGGSGYGHIYHVLLPEHVNICFDATFFGLPDCYLPDNIPAWTNCWHHGSTTFNDAVGHVVFTVLPFQNTPGCDVPPSGTANNQLVDSTNNGLTLNLFEAISNPDNNAWTGRVRQVNNFGIGFICNWQNWGPEGVFVPDFTNYYQVYRTVTLNGHKYTVTPAYSNQIHACAYSASGQDDEQ